MSTERQKNYYEILGVSPSASVNQIGTAYRALAVKYHPDTSGSNADAEEFKLLTEAHAVLSNPESRRRYDQQRSATNRRAFQSGGPTPNVSGKGNVTGQDPVWIQEWVRFVHEHSGATPGGPVPSSLCRELPVLPEKVEIRR